MKKFKSFEEEHDVLMDVYNKIKEDKPLKESNNNLNGINKGDIIVFNDHGKEINGEVINIIGEKYKVKNNLSNTENMMISFDDIIEHYPKNVNFNDKDNIIDKNEKKFNDNLNNNSIKKNIKEEIKEEKLYNDIDNENKYVVFFPNDMKQKDIDMDLKKYPEAKYFIVEKNNEIHIVKIKNDDKFGMKPFVEQVINYLLENKMIKEKISDMKVVGNDSFCIIKKTPKNVSILLKSVLKDLLK